MTLKASLHNYFSWRDPPRRRGSLVKMELQSVRTQSQKILRLCGYCQRLSGRYRASRKP